MFIEKILDLLSSAHENGAKNSEDTFVSCVCVYLCICLSIYLSIHTVSFKRFEMFFFMLF